MVRAFLLWLAVMVAVFQGHAGVGEWKTFTAKREVRDVVRSGDMLWSATSGGLFGYNLSTGTYAEFTTSEGLKTIDLTAVTVDAEGSLWIGAANGVLHKYSPASGEWRYVMDIAILGNPQKRINALRTAGDTLFILSDVGLSLYSISREEFGGTFERFGTDPKLLTGGVTAMSVFEGSMWVGTRAGLASTPVTNSNPASPDSWTVYTTADALPLASVTGLAAQSGSLYISSNTGIAVESGGAFTTLAQAGGLFVVDLFADSSSLTFATPTQLLWLPLPVQSGDGAAVVYDQFPSSITCMRDPGTLGTQKSGVELFTSGSWRSVAPPGPPSNRFISIAVDARGSVWSGTGSANGEGAMSYDGTQWRSYTVQLYPELGRNEIQKVSIGANNSKWLGNWGSGVALIDDAGNVRRVFNTTNGVPPSVPNDVNYAVVGGVATDRNGVAWICNRTAPDSTAVVRFRPDSTLDHSLKLKMRDPDIAFTDVVIDFNNTKWFANFSRFENANPTGLLYYNEGLPVSGSSGGWGRLTTVDGLTTNAVWSLAVDRQGEVWVGSDQGVSILFDPLYPKQRMAAYHPLRDQVIQAIAVDALNDKWIATKQGVFLLSPDGTSILDHFTVESTDGKLLDNDVASIAINHETGMVYCGTEKGLSALTTAAVNPVRDFDKLALAPNPFLLPSQTLLTIDGLVENSTVKVLTIDGSLVREIKSPGGRVGFWDGRDAKGNLASTGVYLIVAFSEDGSKVVTGKLAVVRR